MPGKRFLLSMALLVVIAALPAGPRAAASPAVADAGLEGWSEPVNLSQNPMYDNAPAVAASPNGAVIITWERRILSNPTSNQIVAASNASLGGDFRQQQLAESAPQKTSGGVRMDHDALGRRHLVWWQLDGSAVCDYYARIEADGRTSILEKVPGTCGLNLKNTALAVGADNSVHVLFGRNTQSIFYWARTDAGWVAQGEQIPGTNQPEHLAVGVTTGGVVFAAWKNKADGEWTDIYSATRRGPNDWATEDLTASLSPGCEGNSITYYPTLAADPSGGMRMSWSDERCDPRSPDPPQREIYYREWAPGAGWSKPPVRIAPHLAGNSLENVMVVDPSGTAHITWVNTNGQDINIFYASGRGTTFTTPIAPFAAWRGKSAYTKDIALDYASGYLHLAFDSDRDDPNKEVYYSYRQVAPGPPQATPTPQPPPPPPAPGPPPVPLPGAGSVAFPATGKTVTGLFLQYWNSHGDLAQQGYPISNVMGEVSTLNHKVYTVQYFERAVFEYHPENKPPYDVLLSQLGTYQYKKKYPNTGGAPGQVPDHNNGQFFPETGHWLGGGFKQYWLDHGGLAQQGYPISDQFQERNDLDGKTYIVQYFERSVIEWHPANQDPYKVLLSLLGVFQFRQRYGK
jgi:hypothetical protein